MDQQSQSQEQQPSLDEQAENDYLFSSDPANFVYPEFETEESTTQKPPATDATEETIEEGTEEQGTIEEEEDQSLSSTKTQRKDSNRQVDYSKYQDLFGKTKRLEADVSFYKNQIERLNQQITAQVQKIQALEAAQPSSQTQAQVQAQAPGAEPDAPRLENYQDYDQYIQDLATHKAQTVINKVLKAHNIGPQTDPQDPVHAEMQARGQKSYQMIEDHLRIDKNFEKNSYIPNNLVVPLAGSDKLIEIMYYFGKNRELADRMAMLPPHQVIREIGRLEGKLPPINGKKPRITSQAPRGLSSPDQSAAVSSKNPADMTIDELKKFKAAGGYKKMK